MTGQNYNDEATPLVRQTAREQPSPWRWAALAGCLALVLLELGVLVGRHTAQNASSSLADIPHLGRPKTAAPLYRKIPSKDFGPYQEFSVVHSDRSLNLMSEPFQEVMRDLNKLLQVTYQADRVAIIPGSGTFGMESVARQLATDRHVMVLRNGYFSYRWTEIFAAQPIPRSHTVLKAQPTSDSMGPKSSITGDNPLTLTRQQYEPHPVDRVVARIRQEKPAVVFAPHVETSTGIMLPDYYIRRVSVAIHEVGGLWVLDCIASGTVFVDMKELGVDIVIAAPQKDWTSPPGSALVLLSNRAIEWMDKHKTKATSFSLSLTEWFRVMEAYSHGGFAYHTTPPTDALRVFQRVSVEMMEFGLPELKDALIDMGNRARLMMEKKGLISVAASGYQAPGVLVYYSPSNADDDEEIVSLFQEEGLQIAKGVASWMIDEAPNLKTFRVGLFGLDKLLKEDAKLIILEDAIDNVLQKIQRQRSTKETR